MPRFIGLLLLLAMPVLYACTTTREPLRLYQRNDGDIINVRVGETITVVLEGDPATDIHWIQPTDDPGILEQVGGTSYETDVESYNLERRLMTSFRAVQEGRTRLQLQYRDPAEATLDRTFEVWVVVKPKR